MTAAGLVRLTLISFALAVSLLALDFAKQALEEALDDYGSNVWQLGLETLAASVLAAVAIASFRAPVRLIAAFVPEGDMLDFGADYERWKSVLLMMAGGLVALPALDHLVTAVSKGHVLDTAQALLEISLALVLIVGPGACRNLMLRLVVHR